MSDAPVVLLHGIWMPGLEMGFVKRRLEKEHGRRCLLFDYPSVRGSLSDNAAQLGRFVRSLDVERADFVGHSLGGIVALRMLATFAGAPPGRLVCLGSPLLGSRAARSVHRRGWGRAILGRTLATAAIESSAADWTGPVTASRDIGVIAGSTSAGMGRLVADLDVPNDGTVAVAETRLPGLKDHIVLPVSHTGMALSRAVAGQTAFFLQHGRFRHDADGAPDPKQRRRPPGDEMMEIRHTRPDDEAAIDALYPRAFPDEDLLGLVGELLSAGPDVLSLAAVVDGDVAGHVAFTYCGVEGAATCAALLGPLAVDPRRQRRGIGSALVREGLSRLREAGVDRVFVLGDPAYYGRLGFAAESRIEPPYPLPAAWDGAWQSQALSEAPLPRTGRLVVPSPWQAPALWAP